MGRSRCLALVSLLLLVPSLFFVSPAAATALHSDHVVAFGGRRSLLQVTPPTQAPKAPVSPPVTAPTQAPKAPASPPVIAPTQAPKAPASPPVIAPTQAPKAPASPPVTPPTQAPNPLTPAAGPAPRTPTPSPSPLTTPGPAPVPIFAPAPAPIGVTNSQRRNAIIAAGVIGSVLLVALVLIFCRCRCLKRSKRLPFQRLQMT